MQLENTEWFNEVLTFWFDELSPKDWFMGSKELDANISERFGTTHKMLRESEKIPDPVTGRSTMAAVIVLDQFSRNMFRGDRQAFEYDGLALSLTKHAIATGLDKELQSEQRMFLQMPFMHSEKLEDQETALQLFTGKAHESAVDHHALIVQFGRFPHRNEVLGRQSTEEELSYLKDGKRFGQ